MLLSRVPCHLWIATKDDKLVVETGNIGGYGIICKFIATTSMRKNMKSDDQSAAVRIHFFRQANTFILCLGKITNETDVGWKCHLIYLGQTSQTHYSTNKLTKCGRSMKVHVV